MVRWVVGSILHGVDPLSYFSFQPVLHDWCNKGRGKFYPVCGMMHIKEPLLLIGESSPCGGSGFPSRSPSGPLHFIYGYMASDIWLRTSEIARGNPLPPHRLLLSINSKGSFTCTILQTGKHIPQPLLHQS